MHKIIFLILAIFLITPIGFASDESLNIGNYTVDLNSNITIPIEITKASEIAGGSVKILFDPNIAEVQSVESGDFGIPIANLDNANGLVFIATSSASASDLYPTS